MSCIKVIRNDFPIHLSFDEIIRIIVDIFFDIYYITRGFILNFNLGVYYERWTNSGLSE